LIMRYEVALQDLGGGGLWGSGWCVGFHGPSGIWCKGSWFQPVAAIGGGDPTAGNANEAGRDVVVSGEAAG
jgi:hypothetical protein